MASNYDNEVDNVPLHRLRIFYEDDNETHQLQNSPNPSGTGRGEHLNRNDRGRPPRSRRGGSSSNRGEKSRRHDTQRNTDGNFFNEEVDTPNRGHSRQRNNSRPRRGSFGNSLPDTTRGSNYMGRDRRGRGSGQGMGNGRRQVVTHENVELPNASILNGSDEFQEPENKNGNFRGRGRGGFRSQSAGRMRNQNRESNDVSQGAQRYRTRDQTGPQTITFRKLVHLSDSNVDDPDTLLLEIFNKRSGFLELLQNPIDNDWMYFILKILSIIVKSTISKNRLEFLVVVENNFLSKLGVFLNEVSMGSTNVHKALSKLIQLCMYAIELMKVTMDSLHSSLGHCRIVIFALKELNITYSLTEIDDRLQSELDDVEGIFEAIKDSRDKIMQSSVQQKGKSKRQTVSDENRPPPDNFRELSIFPNTKDLQLDEKPFLRANRTKGKFEDLDTYLDIQFRLLREDYIQPLRKGISEYQHCYRSGGSTKKLRDIRLYHSVQILRPVCASVGIDYILQFDTSYFKKMNWISSRRLLHGSLVCLSTDHFETNVYATVTDRDAKELQAGFIQVRFETIPDVSGNEKFLMAESTAFFEAFRYILVGLQEMTNTMPLQAYIIRCETDIRPPKYLLGAGGPQYDFSSVLNPSSRHLRDKATIFPVLNTTRWPTKDDMGFDVSQYEAIKAAVTKELAIIQGPPGTGKTFIGLKITNLLMANQSMWNVRGHKSPILVVCYTNHALDQFLEGISSFCKKGIVRIGGRCKNEALEQFVLKNLKKEKSDNRKRSWGILQAERDCRSSKFQNQRKITETSSELKKTTTSFVSFDKLKICMTEEQQQSLKEKLPHEKEKNMIPIWLSITVESEESQTKMTEETKMKEMWSLYIVDDISEMTQFEADNVDSDSIWNLELSFRAKLYKMWVSVYIKEIDEYQKQLILQHDKYEAHSLTKAINVLEKAKEEAEISIMPASMLLKKITDPVYVKQIHAVLNKAKYHQIFPGTLDNAMYIWLALDESAGSMVLIKQTLERDEKDKEKEHDTDLEEARDIDDDDDDFLWDYADEKPKHTNKKRDNIKSDGEWIVQWNEKKTTQKVKHVFRKASDLSEIKADSMYDVWQVSQDKRRDLYRYWVLKYRQLLRQNVKQFEDLYITACDRLTEIRDQETLEILRESDFVGMTTTGAAKNRHLMQKVKPRIIIVEEAAEVLESHIITTLNEECQHLILIGDHKQLRPSTTVYELAKKYNLDISLFERLVKNNVPCVTLSEQHRMRPEISVLMRYPNLYPELRDHSSVFRYDNVLGIDRNIQFITHDEEETVSSESTSSSNTHEAKYIKELCKYIINQGYKTEQITVLTPYMGQVFLLRTCLPKQEFDGVRVTAVDNYQGEENDIILLSLVRSSSEESSFQKKNPIGFLGIENRICVALSRAKMGFYVVGNFTLLQQHSEMWQYMADKMKSRDCFQRYVTLRCQNHPDRFINAAKIEDFQLVPEGGCKESCEFRLPCKHICPRFCHVLDKEHKYVKCFKPCANKCDSGHPCKRKCHQECGKCNVSVAKKIPMCNHTAIVPCHVDPHTAKCSTKCDYKLPCGHNCNRKCSDCTSTGKHEEKCHVKVSKKLACDHTKELECSVQPNTVVCPEPCRVELDCKHVCKGTCGECLGGRIHTRCGGSCEKILPCGHTCSYPCSDLCPPCNRKCEWICSHLIKCTNKCSDECETCTEPCRYRFKDSKCDKLCHEKCDISNFYQPCGRELICGHSCQGAKGEPCVCIECQKNKKAGNYVDKSNDEVLIHIPDCGCNVELLRLDAWMTKSADVREELFKRCPICSKVIRRDIKRYTNILKQSRVDIANKYKKIVGSLDDRKQRQIQLKAKLATLKALGLGLTDIHLLLKRLEKNDFSSLYIVGKTLELLKELLKVGKYILDLEQSKVITMQDVQGIVNPARLKRILVQDRQYATKQFWNEINLEITRLALFGKVSELKDLKRKSGLDAYVLEALFEGIMNTIQQNGQFDRSMKESVEKEFLKIKGNVYYI